ncbi:hypothetical protein [Insolitispirillum peregrinum]|uniref:Uncharacterized protein n=1 Tax=Insolitispirillum peregrinum TaxID=80876 RepID=A0A1N7LSZ9_9PROT|nr:hypothetical protein [Insolitispirillum peregrinum]SIS76899.1 hypothetical protein SAMN05421779_103535 [Insolitispirillum peregrinum]
MNLSLSEQLLRLQTLLEPGRSCGMTLEARSVRLLYSHLVAMREQAICLERRTPIPAGLSDPLPPRVPGLRVGM